MKWLISYLIRYESYLNQNFIIYMLKKIISHLGRLYNIMINWQNTWAVTDLWWMWFHIHPQCWFIGVPLVTFGPFLFPSSPIFLTIYVLSICVVVAFVPNLWKYLSFPPLNYVCLPKDDIVFTCFFFPVSPSGR